MTCSRCRKKIGADAERCPHCGQSNRAEAGTFQASTVLISAAGAERVYRSVDEVPPRLRTQLLKSTNGSNSATILIADRRGRKEIARAMRKLPASRQRRLAKPVLGQGDRVAWLTPRRRIGLLVAIALSVGALIWILFTHHWY
jgi:hypothetical protein